MIDLCILILSQFKTNFKKAMKLIYFLATCLLFACVSPKKTGESLYAGSSESGTILLKSSGYGILKGSAIQNAEINAFNNLIFRGIPGSQYSLPMIENEQQAKSEHKDYFNNLYEQKRYKSFLLSTASESDLNINLSSQKTITIETKINVNALRRDMEQNGVIRKFGL